MKPVSKKNFHRYGLVILPLIGIGGFGWFVFTEEHLRHPPFLLMYILSYKRREAYHGIFDYHDARWAAICYDQLGS